MKEEKRTKIDDNEICIKGIDEVPMFSWNTKTKEFYVLGHKFDGINSIEDFINYIHNLDKENKSLQSQLKAKEEVIKEIKNHCEIEINASNHYLENHKSQKELCHKVAHQRILEILSKGENK